MYQCKTCGDTVQGLNEARRHARQGHKTQRDAAAAGELHALELVERSPIAAGHTVIPAELHRTDAEADAAMAEEGGQDAADGERCEPCKGFGLVRGVGKNAGGRYKTLAGAHAAQDAGRAVDCPTCGGLGLVGLKVDEESADSETVPV